MTRSQSNLLNSLEKAVNKYVPENERNGMINILLDLAASIENLHKENENLKESLKQDKIVFDHIKTKQEMVYSIIRFMMEEIDP